MKKHAEIGYTILKVSKSNVIKNAEIIALFHHEKWNVIGYPSGLKGTEVYLYGQITAVVDVFEALTYPDPIRKLSQLKKQYS